MRDARTILQSIATRAMIDYGLEPEWPPQAAAEIARLPEPPLDGLRDLRSLPWSSIDNDDSRDLDQLEVCVEADPARLLVAIADVDVLLKKGSALDAHARTNTTSVYTAARIFPMIPEALSTDRTSLNQGEDRAAIVIDLTVDGDGAVAASDVYRAVVRNKAKLTYSGIAAWLEEDGPAPEAFQDVDGLERQLRLQDEIAGRLRARRQEEGALEFDRREVRPVVDGDVTELRTDAPNRAHDMIESFMVSANGATARFLTNHGWASIRRVVRAPQRWPRIVDIAREHGVTLPGQPDARALERFLSAERKRAPDDFPELSLSVLKLLGRGEYIADGPGGSTDEHFALAVSNYTHSTAPNRRFPDLVTQRLVKAALAGARAPYSLAELSPLAEHCTRQEDAANKVERRVRKAAAALWISNQVGREFDAVVTGASSKGTWVRLAAPPIEGKLERGFEGLDVGDRVRVRLDSTNPEKGFIDFSRATSGPPTSRRAR